MAYNREDKGDAPRRRPNIRRRKKVCIFCGEKAQKIDNREGRSFREESPEHVQSIRERSQLLSREQDISL